MRVVLRVVLLVAVWRSQPVATVADKFEECRNLFTTQGQGGKAEIPRSKIHELSRRDDSMSVVEHLQGFTGLTEPELMKRLMRTGRFHFEGEHAFWDPQSTTELRWYYATSVDYLFANALHIVPKCIKQNVPMFQAAKGPVLDFSGGVGTNVLFLAKLGVSTEYFGIGMIEAAFAEYRVKRMGLEDKVVFRKPHQNHTAWAFDEYTAAKALPIGPRYGGILAMDVLEHIPQYHKTVKELVDRLLPGGFIAETSPFGKGGGGENDLRVHLGNGGVSMSEAMGPTMEQTGKVANVKIWVKKQ